MSNVKRPLPEKKVPAVPALLFFVLTWKSMFWCSELRFKSRSFDLNLKLKLRLCRKYFQKSSLNKRNGFFLNGLIHLSTPSHCSFHSMVVLVRSLWTHIVITFWIHLSIERKKTNHQKRHRQSSTWEADQQLEPRLRIGHHLGQRKSVTVRAVCNFPRLWSRCTSCTWRRHPARAGPRRRPGKSRG